MRTRLQGTSSNRLSSYYSSQETRGMETNSRESSRQERKLCNQHAGMGCLAPKFRHHQVGPVQGL